MIFIMFLLLLFIVLILHNNSAKSWCRYSIVDKSPSAGILNISRPLNRFPQIRLVKVLRDNANDQIQRSRPVRRIGRQLVPDANRMLGDLTQRTVHARFERQLQAAQRRIDPAAGRRDTLHVPCLLVLVRQPLQLVVHQRVHRAAIDAQH